MALNTYFNTNPSKNYKQYKKQLFENHHRDAETVCWGGRSKKPSHKDLCSMLKENLLYENNESTQQPHPNHVSKAHLV